MQSIHSHLEAMLDGPCAKNEEETSEVKLSWFPSHVLKQVCLFFQYKARYIDSAAEIPGRQFNSIKIILVII